MENRRKLIERVKALLAKTVENGCTEAEAMAALAKASEMMDAHNIAQADVTFGGEGVEKGGCPYKKSNFTSAALAGAVAKFTGCRVWNNVGRSGDPEIVFFGLESDVALAQWLLKTLRDFTARAWRDYAKSQSFDSTRHRTLTKNGFLMGCCGRISERLKELESQSRAASPVVDDGRSLIVVKGALVDEAFAKLHLNLRDARSSRRRLGSDGYAAGRAAGDRANFSRPVNGAAGATMIGRA